MINDLLTYLQTRPPVFAPFAGTEGYSPVAYAPYILAAAIGRLLSLDLPELLFLMRFLGLVVFTAVTAYAIAVTPALPWAFVLIAMLPVSLYNRVVLSADGAALSYALVITALSEAGAPRRPTARASPPRASAPASCGEMGAGRR